MKSRTSIKVVSFLWLGSVAGAGCAFITQVVLARALGADTYGLFSSSLGLVTLAVPLVGFGIAQFWLKAFGEEGWRGARWLGGSFQFVVISAVMVTALMALWSVYGPHDAATRGLLLILQVHLIGQAVLELVAAKMQLEERYTSLALWHFLPHMSRLLLVAVCIYVIMGEVSVVEVGYVYTFVSVCVLAMGVSLLIRMRQGFFYLKGHQETGGKLCDPQPNALGVLKEAWPFGAAGVFYLIYFQSDVVLLKYISGDEAAGVYSVAFTILTAVYILPGVVYQKFLMPKIHRWANHEPMRLRDIYYKGNKIMLVLGMASMLAVAALSPFLIPRVFGSEYTASVTPLLILALAIPVRFVASSVGAMLATKGNMRIKIRYMAITAVLNVVLNIVFIPRLGVVGAAVTTVVTDILLLVLYYVAVNRIFVRGLWKEVG